MRRSLPLALVLTCSLLAGVSASPARRAPRDASPQDHAGASTQTPPPAPTPTPSLQTPAPPRQPAAPAVPPGAPGTSSGAGADRAALVRTDRFASASLGRTMTYRLILPADYISSDRRYPTLYLLHGLFGTFSDWESRTDLFAASRPYPFIIVMPEGENSWYTDAQGDPKQAFERYIAKDLIAHIDATYRTIQSRHARGIAGLSMGGYGAMKFALKYPDLFAFAGSLSGAFTAGHDPALDAAFGPAIEQQMRAIYGPPDSPTRAANDIYTLLDKADASALPFLYLDCGEADRFIPANRQFADQLQKKRAAYEYRELPGDHAWEYWDRQVRVLLKVFAAHVQTATPPPAGRGARERR